MVFGWRFVPFPLSTARTGVRCCCCLSRYLPLHTEYFTPENIQPKKKDVQAALLPPSGERKLLPSLFTGKFHLHRVVFTLFTRATIDFTVFHRFLSEITRKTRPIIVSPSPIESLYFFNAREPALPTAMIRAAGNSFDSRDALLDGGGR